jgi:hypothetical protein
MQAHWIPCLQIRHTCIIAYCIPAIPFNRSQHQRNTSINFYKQKAYAGSMSNGSIKRIQSAVDILLQKAPAKIIWNPVTSKYFEFTINFITLTIPGRRNIGLVEGYETLMKPFLRTLRKGQFSYIWKAEFQKRGQLHYHLTTNQYHHYEDIRKAWNKLLRKNGHLDEFGEMHKHFNPNSTDVHAVYKVNNIAAYLSKYMSKKDPVPASAVVDKGKVWDCSLDLKVKRFTIIEEAENNERIYQSIAAREATITKLEKCAIIKMNPRDMMTSTQNADYKNWLK